MTRENEAPPLRWPGDRREWETFRSGSLTMTRDATERPRTPLPAGPLPLEEYDSTWWRLVGNFPQAFSHVGLVNSAFNLTLPESSEHSSARSDVGG